MGAIEAPKASAKADSKKSASSSSGAKKEAVASASEA